NVVLWAYGRQILFNSGGADYEKSQWRDYSVDTFSKNTVLVDGKPQVRDPKNLDLAFSKAPIDARWESNPDHDFGAGIYNEGYGSLDARPATHTRRVLFVKPDLFIVADTLVPNDTAEHTYQARWNLLTTKTQEDPQTQAVTTIDKDLPNLAIVPLHTTGLEVRSASAQSQPELLGWYIQAGRSPEYMPATTVVHTWHGAGVENFLTVLVPIPAGSPSPIKSAKATDTGSATVTFNDGRIFSIVASPDPSGSVEVTETLANGNVGRHVAIAAAVPPVASSAAPSVVPPGAH
ncbi:MAG TPA: heparinase II/III family protein, partial [Candidatus Methylacidiphilales bacterium]